MRAWIEVATRTVRTDVSIRYTRKTLREDENGPYLYESNLNPDPATIARPEGTDDSGLKQDSKEASFVNVMLSLTVDEAEMILSAVLVSRDNSKTSDAEARWRPLAKELTSALQKAGAQKAQLADAGTSAS